MKNKIITTIFIASFIFTHPVMAASELWTDFTIKKVDGSGASLEGAEFSVTEIQPTCLNVSYPGKSDVWLLNKGALISPDSMYTFSAASSVIYRVAFVMDEVVTMDGVIYPANTEGLAHNLMSLEFVNINYQESISEIYLLPFYNVDTAEALEYYDNITFASVDELEDFYSGIQPYEVSMDDIIISPQLESHLRPSIITFKHKLPLQRTDQNGEVTMNFVDVAQMQQELLRRFNAVCSFNGEFGDGWGDLIIQETIAPSGYELQLGAKNINYSEANSSTFVNKKKAEEKLTEEPTDDSDIAVPNTGNSTSLDDGLGASSSILPFFGLITLAICLIARATRRTVRFD